MIKNVKYVELYISIATVFLNTQTLNMIYQNKNVSVVIKIINDFFNIRKFSKHNNNKTKIKLDLLMVEKKIRGVISDSIY